MTICTGLFMAGARQADGQIQSELDAPILMHFDDDFVAETWNTLGAGIAKHDAATGNLVIDRIGPGVPGFPADFDVVYVELADTTVKEGSIRAQARMTKEDRTGAHLSSANSIASVTLAARTCFNGFPHVCGDKPESWIYIDVHHDGEINAAPGPDGDKTILQTDLRPLEQDILLQLDAFGDDIKIWAWHAGNPRPEDPLVQYTSADNPTTVPGGIMFGTLMSDARYRWVHISPTPIPGEVLGDFDGDGAITARDIDLLVVGGDPLMDLNGDGQVDAADRDIWVQSPEIANTFYGDADLNGKVEFGDFLVLSAHFGQAGGWSRGDFDGNGDVQFDDFLLLSANFGSAREAAIARSVPEPNASVLMLAACLSPLTHFRRRRRSVNRTATKMERIAARPQGNGLTAVCSLLVMLLLATANTAAQVVEELGNLEVDKNLCTDRVTINVPEGTFNSFRVHTDWEPLSSLTWSREQLFAIADSCRNRPTTTFYTHPGPHPDSKKNSDPMTFTWEGFLDIPFHGPGELLLLPLQAFGDSPSRWGNTVFELSFQEPPTPPDLVAELGIVADEFGPLNLATFGDSDTELAVYSPTSRIVAENDDELNSGSPTYGSSRIEFANGLPAGDYIAAVGMFNTSFEHAYQIKPGAVGGDYGLDVAGQLFEASLASGEIGYVGFSIGPAAEMNAIVPEPHAAGLILLACCLCLVRRQRRRA